MIIEKEEVSQKQIENFGNIPVKELKQNMSYTGMAETSSKTNKSPIDYLREFIDNSISAKRQNVPLNVEIRVIEKEPNEWYFQIIDNGIGFFKDKQIVKNALTIGKGQKITDLNEHGLGLKTSILSLGKLEFIYSVRKNWNKGRLITGRLHKDGGINLFGIDKNEVDLSYDQGTLISFKIEKDSFVKQLTKNNPASGFKGIGLNVLLGAIYRRWLNDDMNLYVTVKNYDENNNIQKKKIDPVTPNYYDPFLGKRGFTLVEELTGRDWKATVRVGLLMSDEEAKRFDDVEPIPNNTIHPYRASSNAAGLDIIKDGRVISFSELEKFGITANQNRNYLCGEVELNSGFDSTHAKNDIYQSDEFNELSEKVNHLLKDTKDGTTILTRARRKQNKKKIGISEKKLNRNLTGIIKDGRPEYQFLYENIDSIENFKSIGTGGEVDIHTDRYLIEIKTTKLEGIEGVGQLAVYLAGQDKKGMLIAPGFSKTVRNNIQKVEDEYNIIIETRKINELPGDVLDE